MQQPLQGYFLYDAAEQRKLTLRSESKSRVQRRSSRAALRKLLVLRKHISTLGENLNDESNARSGLNKSWALICVILNAIKYRHQGCVNLLAYDLPYSYSDVRMHKNIKFIFRKTS